MEYSSWQEFAQAAHQSWKKGDIQYTDYWLCEKLARGILVDIGKGKGKIEPQELSERAERISSTLGIDYNRELQLLLQEIENI